MITGSRAYLRPPRTRAFLKSYIVIYTPDGNPTTEDFQGVKRECERFGLGLVTFTDGADPSTYETVQEAERRTPDLRT